MSLLILPGAGWTRRRNDRTVCPAEPGSCGTFRAVIRAPIWIYERPGLFRGARIHALLSPESWDGPTESAAELSRVALAVTENPGRHVEVAAILNTREHPERQRLMLSNTRWSSGKAAGVWHATLVRLGGSSRGAASELACVSVALDPAQSRRRAAGCVRNAHAAGV